MLLVLIGLQLSVAGVVGFIIGLVKMRSIICIISIAIPALYWGGIHQLWQADQRFIQEETEKNEGQLPDWVW